MSRTLKTLSALILSSFLIHSSAAIRERCEYVTEGASPVALSAVASARQQCPALGAILEKFALEDLGEVFLPGRPEVLSPGLVELTAAAASGDESRIRFYAHHAVNTGATRLELEQLLYLTAVHEGLTKAIPATRAVMAVLITNEGS